MIHKPKTIWKYELEPQEEQRIKMPQGSEILCVQIRSGTPWLWALVCADHVFVERLIYVRGTGRIADGLCKFDYIGTFEIIESQCTYHVFDGGEVEIA